MAPKEAGEESHPVCGPGSTSQIIYAWAMDAPALDLPDGVGFRVGAGTNIKYLVLQVHYASTDYISQDGDDSGVFLEYTEQECATTNSIHNSRSDKICNEDPSKIVFVELVKESIGEGMANSKGGWQGRFLLSNLKSFDIREDRAELDNNKNLSSPESDIILQESPLQLWWRYYFYAQIHSIFNLDIYFQKLGIQN